jgi:hypothetical protein
VAHDGRELRRAVSREARRGHVDDVRRSRRLFDLTLPSCGRTAPIAFSCFARAMLKLEPCNCPHTLSERRGWAPFLALALTLALLVFRAALSYINTPPLAGSFSNKNFDPFSLEFPGNETVGTVHLSPCEDGVDCGYIVYASSTLA